jgi:hypothetical protein
MRALSDGLPHPHDELYRLLEDEMATSQAALAFHMMNMRRKLREEGKDIVGRNGHYSLVRLVRID